MIGLTYSNDLGYADVTFTDGLLVDDPGLVTACWISLYTDRRDSARAEGDRGGWWGTQLDDAGDEWGSLLWTLRNAHPIEDTRGKAERYASDALTWLITDGIAQSVKVTAVWAYPNPGIADLRLAIDIKRPEDIAPRRLAVWEAFLGA